MRRRMFGKKNYPDGLLHLYRLNGDLRDAVAGAHGIADGSITYMSGLFGQCAKLTAGANIKIDLNYVLSQYTIQAWVKCVSLNPYAAILMSRISNTNVYGFYFNNDQSAVDLTATESNNGQTGWPWGDPFNWQLYTFTSDGNTVKCYINGVQQSISWWIGNTARYLKLRSNTRIGRDSYSTARNLDGFIQQVMIWDKALSQSEITKYYNNGKGLMI